MVIELKLSVTPEEFNDLDISIILGQLLRLYTEDKYMNEEDTK
jgi:hypothetical protein